MTDESPVTERSSALLTRSKIHSQNKLIRNEEPVHHNATPWYLCTIAKLPPIYPQCSYVSFSALSPTLSAGRSYPLSTSNTAAMSDPLPFQLTL